MRRTDKITYTACLIDFLMIVVCMLLYCVLVAYSIKYLAIYGSNTGLNVILFLIADVCILASMFFVCRTVYRSAALRINLWRCRKFTQMALRLICSLELDGLTKRTPKIEKCVHDLKFHMKKCTDILSNKNYKKEENRKTEVDVDDYHGYSIYKEIKLVRPEKILDELSDELEGAIDKLNSNVDKILFDKTK